MNSTVTRTKRKGLQPDEMKDDQAMRLRSAGWSFREIAAEMRVDVSMAHRRVKRAMILAREKEDQRMEDIRDLDLEKFRRIEKAILPDAFIGDLAAARVVLRIAAMRRQYYKDLPLRNAPGVSKAVERERDWLYEDIDLPTEESAVEDEAVAVEQEVAAAGCHSHDASREGHEPPEKLFCTDPSTQQGRTTESRCSEELTTIGNPSTDPSTNPSTDPSTNWSTRSTGQGSGDRCQESGSGVCSPSQTVYSVLGTQHCQESGTSVHKPPETASTSRSTPRPTRQARRRAARAERRQARRDKRKRLIGPAPNYFNSPFDTRQSLRKQKKHDHSLSH